MSLPGLATPLWLLMLQRGLHAIFTDIAEHHEGGGPGAYTAVGAPNWFDAGRAGGLP